MAGSPSPDLLSDKQARHAVGSVYQLIYQAFMTFHTYIYARIDMHG